MAMDSVDIVQEASDMYLQNLLKNHRVRSAPFSGFCLCCKDPVIQRRFCDAACRESYEHKLRMKLIVPDYD